MAYEEIEYLIHIQTHPVMVQIYHNGQGKIYES